MAMILSKQNCRSLETFKIFYLRRIKRIVPIFVIIVFAVYVYAYLYAYMSSYAYGFYKILIIDGAKFRKNTIWALTFVANMNFFEEKGYFEQVSTVNAFKIMKKM